MGSEDAGGQTGNHPPVTSSVSPIGGSVAGIFGSICLLIVGVFLFRVAVVNQDVDPFVPFASGFVVCYGLLAVWGLGQKILVHAQGMRKK